MRQTLRVSFLVLSVIVLAGAFSSIFQPRASLAEQNVRQRFEYCAITNAQSMLPRDSKENVVAVASICYIQTSGCRREEVTFELDSAEFLKEIGDKSNTSYFLYAARVRAAESAVTKAISKLGEEGWEIVGDGPLDFVNYNEGNMKNKAVYFKRLKSR